MAGYDISFSGSSSASNSLSSPFSITGGGGATSSETGKVSTSANEWLWAAAACGLAIFAVIKH